jgi:hypothetical protein
VNVHAVDRMVRTPADSWHAVRRLSHGALDNARRSLDEISRAVTDRQALAPVGVPEPGGLGVLDTSSCWELLGERSVGRLAYVARAGVPDLVPVNYTVAGQTLLLRSGAGPKLQAAQRGDMAAFEVDDLDEDVHGGWSVVVVGRLEVVAPAAVAAGAAPDPWANGPRSHLVRLVPQRVTGRRLAPQPATAAGAAGAAGAGGEGAG